MTYRIDDDRYDEPEEEPKRASWVSTADEPEEEPKKFTPLDVARHAPLFIRELLATDRTPKTLRQYFAAAFAQISQSELNELP